jgi:hypothetical protein
VTEYLDLPRIDRLKAHVCFLTMRLMGWRPIATAPTDGTPVLVINCEDDVRAQVVVARHHTYYGTKDFDPPNPHPRWWGAGWRTGWSEWDTEHQYGRSSDIALSPQWWKPLPKPSKRFALMHYWASWLHYHRRDD